MGEINLCLQSGPVQGRGDAPAHDTTQGLSVPLLTDEKGERQHSFSLSKILEPVWSRLICSVWSKSYSRTLLLLEVGIFARRWPY